MEARVVALQSEVESINEFRRHAHRLELDLIREVETLRTLLPIRDHVRARPGGEAAQIMVSARGGERRLGFVDEEGSADPTRAYAEFERMFRGSREEIVRRQAGYLGIIGDNAPVLDLGCGRGEMLQVLADRGLEAYGVDLDAGMVAEAASRGLDARIGDLFDVVAATDDGSVGAVFSAQVIEHLQPQDMRRLLEETFRVLRDDGIAIIETVNPHSLRALRFFWLDLTHVMPVYPESALMLARAAGFPAACIHFPGGHPDLATSLAEDGDFALVAAKQPDRLRAAGLLA